MELDLLQNHLTIHSSIGRNYHIPSMNDLYWIPGGNSDLKPEDAVNLEVGLDIKHPLIENSVLSFNFFSTETDNWIRWQPTSSGIYVPDNLRKVETKGGEVMLKHQFSKGKYKLRITAEYSFVTSQMIEAYHPYELQLVGKQLMHIPNHKAAAGLYIIRGNTTIVLNHAYTGSRFTDADNTAWLDGFLLSDARIEHWVPIKKSTVGMTLGVFNWKMVYHRDQTQAAIVLTVKITQHHEIL
jgi:iron complex outermembrane receptor protein